MNLEELIFNIYKDEPVVARKFRETIMRKYELSIRQISDIYAKINNYQLNKYGSRLIESSNVEFLSKEECQRRAKVRRIIKYQKIK